jgi:hypothetical protein
MSLDLEDEMDLEEASEVEPLFSRAEAIARPYALAGPRPIRVTVSGFSRYSNRIASLPAHEQIRLRKVARLIAGSFRPNCRPIVAVRLVGHANYDSSRDRHDPDYMMRISRARALAVRQVLERLIDNPAIASRLAWDVRAAGANRPAIPNPTTETARRHNRRVEVWLSGKAGLREFEGPAVATRPAPNAVDPESAEPIFTGRVRIPEAPLLDPAALKSSSASNQTRHPKDSGITLAELRARLERYIDRPALDDLVRRANAGAASPYGSDETTLVTLLAHQFQRKTCRKPTVGDISKACTADGRIGEDTLDALGFVYHAGKALNAADQSNAKADIVLKRVPASAFADVEPGLTAKTWWSYMVSPPWLGLPIKQGIHLVLLKRLRRVQHALMNLPAYANLSPVELGRALGLEEEHKGARPGSAQPSMHTFGLGIDIGFTRNPWVTRPEGNPAKVEAITRRAAMLVGSSGAGANGITARYLHGLAVNERDTERIHKILVEWNRWLGEYFALAGNAKRLESLLPVANVIYPDAGWFKPGESVVTAAKRWSGLVRTDFDDFANAVSRGGSKKNEVRNGFMDLAHDLVIALRDEGCLGWGAVDFGPAQSGDMMHFDCRVEGIGRTIAKASGKPFVPDSGHPCLPTGASPPARREFELTGPTGQRKQAIPGPRPAAPPKPPAPLLKFGHWLGPFDSSTIDHYKGEGAAKPSATQYLINVSDAAWKQNKRIDLLVFFHGDPDPCANFDKNDPNNNFDPDLKNYFKKFALDAQIDNTKRPAAVVVPRIFWIPGNKNNDANIRGIWTAAKFNDFIDNDVLEQINSASGVKPKINRLIIVGHSHAYAILTSLACEFNQDAQATKERALASLKEIWAFDTTYSAQHVRALEAWAYKRPDLRFTAVLNNTEYQTPFNVWKSYYAPNDYCPKGTGFKPPSNLIMIEAPKGVKHCAIPAKYVDELLFPESLRS